MASRSSAAMFLLFLLSAASVLPSEAQLIKIKGLQVAGVLYCSTTGNPCPTCPGLGGVNVTITCNIGASASTSSVLTGPGGLFSTVFGLLDGLVLGTSPILPCVATVQLPVLNCTLLPTNGTLQAPLTLTGNLITGLLGLLGQAVVGVFSLVTVT